MAVETRTTEAFLERAFADLAGSYGGVMVSIGHRLGLYRALAGRGPLSSRRAGCPDGMRGALRARVAQLAGRRRVPRLPRRVRDVRAAGRARPGARRRGEPGVPAARLRDPRVDVVRPGADARGVPHGRRHPVGGPRRSALLRRLDHLPERVPRLARARVAACARRRRREAGARRARGGRRLRPRPLDGADGVGVPALALRRLRHARGVARGGPRPRAGGRSRGADRVPARRRRLLSGPGLRPDLLLRLPARPGRPGRRGAARVRGARRRRNAVGRRAVRRRRGAGQPRADRPSLLLGFDGRSACRTRGRRTSDSRSGHRPVQPDCRRCSGRPASGSIRTAHETPFNIVLEVRR